MGKRLLGSRYIRYNQISKELSQGMWDDEKVVHLKMTQYQIIVVHLSVR
jgi:hypothetical protein